MLTEKYAIKTLKKYQKFYNAKKKNVATSERLHRNCNRTRLRFRKCNMH